jgi:hypothetical protein
MARSMFRHVRVASKAELKARILAYLEDINAEPVVHTWTYKIGEVASHQELRPCASNITELMSLISLVTGTLLRLATRQR